MEFAHFPDKKSYEAVWYFAKYDSNLKFSYYYTLNAEYVNSSSIALGEADLYFRGISR